MYPIVLIHGFPFDGGMWRSQAEYLRGRGLQVMTPDLPGFGHSTVAAMGETEASIEGFAEHVRAVIARDARGKAIVGGLSMGGYILLALLRAHPECVAGAMLLDTRAEADSPEGREGRLRSIAEIESGKGTGLLINTMMGRLFARGASDSVRAEARTIMERQSPDAVISAQAAMSRRRDQTDVLGTLRMPVLLVVGAEDGMTPPSVAMALRDRITGANGGGGGERKVTMVEVEGAGHMSPMEKPEAVSRAMEAFARSI